MNENSNFLSANDGYGGIAQLGERLNGIQEVSGSIPLISTKMKDSCSRKDMSPSLLSKIVMSGYLILGCQVFGQTVMHIESRRVSQNLQRLTPIR